jgi:hypothetical protein
LIGRSNRSSDGALPSCSRTYPPKGTTGLRVVDPDRTRGLAIDRRRMGFLSSAIRPASGVVDRFTYEIQNGSETARASVLLAARSWTPEARSGTFNSCPRAAESSCDSTRCRSSVPGARPSPWSSRQTWNELGQGDSDQAGRLLWTGSVGFESHRVLPHRTHGIPLKQRRGSGNKIPNQSFDERFGLKVTVICSGVAGSRGVQATPQDAVASQSSLAAFTP